MAQAEMMHLSAFGFGDGFVHTATLFNVTGHGVIHRGGSRAIASLVNAINDEQ